MDEKKIVDVAEIKLKRRTSFGESAATAATVAVGVELLAIKKAILNFSGVVIDWSWCEN